MPIELKFETTVPFAGFYSSIHDDQIDGTIEQEIECMTEEDNKTKEQAEAWQETIDHTAIRRAYSQEYVDFLTSELEIPSLAFKALESPREYNFETDRIVCTIGQADLKKLYDKWINEPELREAIKDQFTSYDGFISFYSNDVNAWKEKPLHSWDHNEIGMLISEEFTDKGIVEDDVFNWSSSPIHEVIRDNFPDESEQESEPNG